MILGMLASRLCMESGMLVYKALHKNDYTESGVDLEKCKSTPDSVWNPECRCVDRCNIGSLNRGSIFIFLNLPPIP